MTSIDGLYQNFGPRSTAQCPGSLGAHPRTAMNHDNWSWENNLTIIHQLMVKIRNVLRQQSYYSGFSCGQIFASTLKVVTGSQYDDIFSRCLFTGLHLSSRHIDPDMMAKTDSATCRSYWEAEDKHDVQRFIGNMDSIFPRLKKKGRLPMETTSCAWTRAQKNNEFTMR